MKIKIKWKPFIGLLSPPFSYPPYLPFTPLFQKTPFKIKFVLEKLAHIIETIVVESLTLSLKSSLLNHPLPPLKAPKKNLVTFATKLATFLSLNSTTFHYHHNNATLKKNRNLQILFGTKTTRKKTHTPPHYCLLTKV